jgi:hypothetical protein
MPRIRLRRGCAGGGCQREPPGGGGGGSAPVGQLRYGERDSGSVSGCTPGTNPGSGTLLAELGPISGLAPFHNKEQQWSSYIYEYAAVFRHKNVKEFTISANWEPGKVLYKEAGAVYIAM